MATHEPARVSARTERAALLHGVYVIVNASPACLDVARAALGAGVRVLQYRAKDGVDAAHLQTLRALTHDARALLIVNDDWRAALAFDCDGVHLGPDDAGFANVAAVRAHVGDRLIGLSCGTHNEARAAHEGGADYLGVGSVYATASKADVGAPIGIEGLVRVAAAGGGLPVAAIGGIDRHTIGDVARSGVAMAAVISAVAAAPDPARAARELVGAWRANAP